MLPTMPFGQIGSPPRPDVIGTGPIPSCPSAVRAQSRTVANSRCRRSSAPLTASHSPGNRPGVPTSEAMAQAGIDDPADVHYVQTKTPLLTIDTIQDAKSRGQSVFTENTGESMDV